MGWAVTPRITCMTCTPCVTTKGPCREEITQVAHCTRAFTNVTHTLHHNVDRFLFDILLDHTITSLQIMFYFNYPSAYCKNSIDGQWYCFDDSDVQSIADDEVCKQTAYILFYQRRATIPSWSANSSVAGSFKCAAVLQNEYHTL